MAISVRELSTGYEKPYAAVDNVSFELQQGEILGIIGQNGAGKSTLIRCMSGMLAPWNGSMHCEGENLTRATPRRRVRSGIVVVPENRQIFGTLSVRDNLQVAALGLGVRLRPSTMASIADRFPILAERSVSPASGLSGGEQQMLAIARVLISKPRYILMDEPTLGLSPALVVRVGDIITSIAADGIGVLLVEQNSSLIERLCASAMVLNGGRIRRTLNQQELQSGTALAAAYFDEGESSRDTTT